MRLLVSSLGTIVTELYSSESLSFPARHIKFKSYDRHFTIYSGQIEFLLLMLFCHAVTLVALCHSSHSPPASTTRATRAQTLVRSCDVSVI